MNVLRKQNSRLPLIFVSIGLLLLIPLTAMQFTNEVNWSITDFLVMGILLTGVGITCELIYRSVKSKKSRIVLYSGIILLFLLVWVELAVGIFGSVFSGS
ncbi:hypothetical protein HX109_11095 [Galbibacter sp. BG1]|uniref:hypothetical protein n=1 Tax=Galbibacter sp. BG1 TaxID=1170699 RepID=UPI0015BF6FB9|nr:hypothetical protein [Galbibacter sp. BG1]QLE02074.1 hypothetical protein HX109_11095 [Galbibacter sp. BG1]